MSISPELQGLASLAIATKLESLPDQLVRELKYLVLDSIGCALAGIRTDPGRMFIDLGKTLGGAPESSLIGVGCKVSCVNAAMVNGQLINMIDYDALMPGHHTPPYIIAPSLAMAEREQASGADFLFSIAVGSEIAGRVGNAVSEGFSFQGADGTIFTWSERWGHAFCNFGVAAAVGRLLKLDTDKLVNAMGLSGHLCQVPTWRRFTFSEHRSMAKYGVPGWQNTGGVIAALLAQMGYMGDTTVFDEKEGFWKYTGYEAWNPENILKDIGSTWIMQRINYKPYPCCRMTHSAIDGALELRSSIRNPFNEIESIQISVSRMVKDMVGMPFSIGENPQVSAQFSIPYTVSAALLHGDLFLESFEDVRIRDESVLRLSQKIEVIEDPSLAVNDIYHMTMLTRLDDGQLLEIKKDIPLGNPRNPLGLEQVKTKFSKCVSYSGLPFGSHRLESLIESIENLEELNDVSDLAQKLSLPNKP